MEDRSTLVINCVFYGDNLQYLQLSSKWRNDEGSIFSHFVSNVLIVKI